MRGRKALATGLLAGALALATLSNLVRRSDQPVPPSAEAANPAASALQPGASAALETAPGRPQPEELDRLIRAYERQVESAPNATALTFLGRLEIERARLTGDTASYARARTALKQAVGLGSEDPQTGSLLASVLYTVHDFAGALELARSLYERDGSPEALAVMADSEMELGRYAAAQADYRALSSVLPEVAAVHARLARIAFLHGEISEARRRAARALDLARREGAFGTTLAWYESAAGQLALDLGRYGEAADHYRRAVEEAPRYHVALAGLAAVRAAQGRYDDAIVLYRRAAALVPEPMYLGALGDLYSLRGDEPKADLNYRTVETIVTLSKVNRRLFDRQLAMFYADHDRKLQRALHIARASLRVRRDVYGFDVYAWVLFKLGRYQEAGAVADQALRLGTPDARLWYHAGLISAALGHEERGRLELDRALTLSPRFDPLQASIAREVLSELGGTS